MSSIYNFITGIHISDLIRTIGYYKLAAITAVILSTGYILIEAGYCLYRLIFPMPDTGFGFKGIVVYKDDAPNTKVLLSHKFKIAAKPDIVFKIWRNKYALIEYKHRKGEVKESDINQTIASVIATRSQYNIRVAYIITEKKIKKVPYAHESTPKLFNRIKTLHKTAYRIKNKSYKPKRITTTSKCRTCSYKNNCLK